ncbi:MAG: SLC13 family permease [Gammaproteobacteria bacterium]|nr:SLC13 family permease [Gammaproteobacteria bacterium]NIR84141.1 SLC13 family permease [Gammaproteobacteria bacterium]NIR89453.1 SLC13 family permease [Gammaproteobacteria bacterium]NIU05296.1 SLC13 family permease [Gammaproteobacteria bacterium]NIV52236.1 SLC13 family permease [Gammaproteobacteria bacterium]
MTSGHIIVFAILAAALALFVWGRWRYDVVAFAALMVGVIAGVVPTPDAFRGFGHPAVVTVAAVLVISRALQNSGAIEHVAAFLGRTAERELLHLVGLCVVAAFFSAFMNNVGALALLMPVAVQNARNPATVLMPLSFGSILGGLMTQIGTPPNIVIAVYRDKVAEAPFSLFDFSPVGVPLAVTGVAFVTLVGWRLLPKDRRGKRAPEELFEIKEYITEVQVTEGSDAIDKELREVEEAAEHDVTAIGLIRGDRRILSRVRHEPLRAGDVVILQADPATVEKFVGAAGLELVADEEISTKTLRSEDVSLAEVVVPRGAWIEGRTASSLHLRRRYGVNLLALARQGKPVRERLADTPIRAGDVLLLQGETETLFDTVSALGCLPLAERGLKLGGPRQLYLPVLVFLTAVGATAMGIAPVHISFGTAVAVLLLLNLVTARHAYEAIDWPVIVLLGAMIPLGQALETSGGTDLIARAIVGATGDVPLFLILALVMIVTMTLSDIMNNAATAVVMAPIAARIAAELGASADPFLMATAIGASCAFLTPIGHQNNVLVMGPGGYRFGDYWRMGLPLEVLIVLLGVPLVMMVWPP